MKTLAAVLVETGRPLVVAELELPALKPGQVLVQIVFSAACHTQLLECRGYRGEDRYLPHCLGHEGSGVVCETGPGVTKVKAGDPVILSWMKGSGADVAGTVYRWGNRPVNAGGVTTFSRHAIVSENRLTIMPNGLPMDEAALLGCAVPTGLGAVLNTAGAQPGQTIAVFGTGGVGLCAVAGAAIAGCSTIIAIDRREEPLALAERMGATHRVRVADGADPVLAVTRICPGGVDVAIEASGRPQVMRQALSSVRARGGVAVVVGNARHGERLDLDPTEFNLGKRLLGTWGGDNQPDRDFPRYSDFVMTGTLNLKPLRSAPHALTEINEALDRLEAGTVLRPVIDMSLELAVSHVDRH